jgi:hypothetical protein
MSQPRGKAARNSQAGQYSLTKPTQQQVEQQGASAVTPAEGKQRMKERGKSLLQDQNSDTYQVSSYRLEHLPPPIDDDGFDFDEAIIGAYNILDAENQEEHFSLQRRKSRTPKQ